MADLETLVNELPNLVYSLKLTIGDSPQIMQQVAIINNTQEQLRNIQQTIAQELRFTKIKSAVISTLPRINTEASLFLPNVFLADKVLTGKTKLISEKFGNSKLALSLNDLQTKIDCWIEWGDLLQAIAADILSNDQLVNQLNSAISYPNLLTKSQEIEEIFGSNSNSGNYQTIQQLNNAQSEALQIQQKLNHVINTIKNSQSLLTILLGISSLYGKYSFALEWLNDDNELIISSDGKFQNLTDIINDCKAFQNQINTLILQGAILKEQAEETLINLNHKNESITVIYNPKTIVSKSLAPKIFNLTLVIATSVVVLGFGGWIIKDQIPQFPQTRLSFNQEESAIANFKAAQNLGMEASFLVQDPPHPFPIWQQAANKWQQAINLLEAIPEGTSVSEQAKQKLAQYRFNYNAISQKLSSKK